jgi:DNA-binding NtrC family response regulator
MVAMPIRRILLVDDDTQLTALLERFLRRMGFEVHSLCDPRAARECFRTAAAPFDLVVTDMTMPGLSGEELLRDLLDADVKVRAILCSGYPMAGATLEKQYAGRMLFLQKPFIARMLAETIEKLGAPDHSHPAPSKAS